ncbi:50S ribosomal protein L17, partial [Clavibacter lycopersici]
RITKLGFRKGDNAPMVQIELVLEPADPEAHRRPEPATASA